jgi:hypothetical protein
MAGEEGDGDAEARHLGEGQVHENDAAGKDVKPEVDVDAREDETRDQGRPQELEHRRGGGRQRGVESASVRRPTFRSKRVR